MAKKVVSNKKKEKRLVASGIAHIHSTFNNTIITISDATGNVLCWSSAGASNFKGSRKGTPFAAQVACEKAVRKAVEHGMKQIEVRVSGPGSGRDTAIRSINNGGMEVTAIVDVTPLPYNGCRPPKKRRT